MPPKRPPPRQYFTGPTQAAKKRKAPNPVFVAFIDKHPNIGLFFVQYPSGMNRMMRRIVLGDRPATPSVIDEIGSFLHHAGEEAMEGEDQNIAADLYAKCLKYEKADEKVTDEIYDNELVQKLVADKVWYTCDSSLDPFATIDDLLSHREEPVWENDTMRTTEEAMSKLCDASGIMAVDPALEAKECVVDRVGNFEKPQDEREEEAQEEASDASDEGDDDHADEEEIEEEDE